MKKARSRNQTPLLEVRRPVRIRAYRGTFTPFESTRFLDVKALKRARKATIECGTIEAGGFTQTVSAVIENGRLVALKPIGCDGCGPRARNPKKLPGAELKQAMADVRRQLTERGIDVRPRPATLRISPRLGFQIPIGPIIIIIGDPAPGGIFDVCFEWWDGNRLCWWCLIGASGCITFG